MSLLITSISVVLIAVRVVREQFAGVEVVAVYFEGLGRGGVQEVEIDRQARVGLRFGSGKDSEGFGGQEGGVDSSDLGRRADEDDVDVGLEAVSGLVEDVRKVRAGLRWHLRADPKGWRMASFFAAASLLALFLFSSVSSSVSVIVALEMYVLTTDRCHTTDRLAISNLVGTSLQDMIHATTAIFKAPFAHTYQERFPRPPFFVDLGGAMAGMTSCLPDPYCMSYSWSCSGV